MHHSHTPAGSFSGFIASSGMTASECAAQPEPRVERIARSLGELNDRLANLSNRVFDLAQRVCGNQPEPAQADKCPPSAPGLLNGLSDALSQAYRRACDIADQISRLEREGL